MLKVILCLTLAILMTDCGTSDDRLAQLAAEAARQKLVEMGLL